MKLYIEDISNYQNEDFLVIKNRFPKKYESTIRIINEEEKLRHLVASILLIKAFPNIKEEDIYFNEFHKPYLKNYFFNISHYKNKVVLLTNKDNEVGIDIVKLKENNHESIIDLFNENEINYLKNKDKDEILKLWAIKESLIKLLGKGISKENLKINVLDLINNSSMYFENKKIYNFTKFIDDYFISICTFEPFNSTILDIEVLDS